MGMFDGQAAEISLSDEALFDLAEDEAGKEEPEERQETEQPQTEAEAESPATEQTSNEAEAEAAAPDGQPAEQQEDKTEQTQFKEEAERLERQAQAATARMTRACQEAAELRRQNEQLNQLLRNLQQPAQPAPKTAQDNEEFVQSFLQNPQAELARLAREQAATMASAQVKEVLRPVLQSLEHKNREEAWTKAWQEQAPAWPQLAGEDGKQQLMQRMAQISADLGDTALWQKQPARLLQMAAVELFGLPKAVNEDAIRAASEAGRKAALTEFQQKNNAKAGLAAATGANKNAPPSLSAEEQIVKDIEAAFGSKIL